MNKVNVGIIGLGRQGLRHVSALTQFEDVAISSVCDADEAALKGYLDKFKAPSHYTDYRKMADDKSLDCVFVVTKPDETHTQITNAFLENGKHVFCEKPMGTSLPQAREVVKKAEKSSRILMIGYNRRYMPIFQRAKRELQSPTQVDICRAEMCGEKTILRGLNSNYVHLVDVLRWYCGEPAAIEATAKYIDPNHEETIAALIKFKEGAVGIHISNSNSGGYVERVTMFGDHKTIEVDTPSLTCRCLRGGGYQPAIVTNHITESWKGFTYKFGFEQEDRHFIDCIKNDESPLTSGEDSLKTLYLVDAIYSECGLPTLESS